MEAIWISVIIHEKADAPGCPSGKLEMFGDASIPLLIYLRLMKIF